MCRAIGIFVIIMVAGERRKLILNYSSLSLIQAAGFLLSLVVIPHVLRRVGADGFGVIAVAQVLMFYLSAFTDYGFYRTATKDIALYKHDRHRISSVFFTVLFSKALLCFFSFCILVLLLLAVPLFRDHYPLYLLAFTFVAGQVCIVNWFFQGMEKMQYMALTTLLGRLIFVGLVFIFIRGQGDKDLYIFFLGAGNVIAGVLSIVLAIRMYKLKFVLPAAAAIHKELKNGWQVTVTHLSQTTCQYIGVFILRIFTNDTLVGYYSVAERIYFAMKLMLDAMGQVLYPGICRVVQDGKEKIIAYFRRTFVPFLVLAITGTALVFVFAAQILHFFIGHHMEYSVFLLRMLCIAVLIVCMNIPPQLVLFAGDHKKNFLKIFTMGTLLNVLANLVLARYFDATGTVISVLVTELFITAGLYRAVYRIYFLKQQSAPDRTIL